MGHARPFVEPPSAAAPRRQRWPSEGGPPGAWHGGREPSQESPQRGALGCQACGVSRAPSRYAHRCPQQRWPMRPATCVWPRTPRALRRSSLPSGCKVSCGERAAPTPGDSAAEQGLVPRARSQCGQTQHLVLPRGPPPLCLRGPRPLGLHPAFRDAGLAPATSRDREHLGDPDH